MRFHQGFDLARDNPLRGKQANNYLPLETNLECIRLLIAKPQDAPSTEVN